MFVGGSPQPFPRQVLVPAGCGGQPPLISPGEGSPISLDVECLGQAAQCPDEQYGTELVDPRLTCLASPAQVHLDLGSPAPQAEGDI